ncbi:hypothetical protein ID866_11242 [Astraeus odoratus]|nr:hypothetical protein ID866_11242 [Astraeus odoratus]
MRTPGTVNLVDVFMRDGESLSRKLWNLWMDH